MFDYGPNNQHCLIAESFAVVCAIRRFGVKCSLNFFQRKVSKQHENSFVLIIPELLVRLVSAACVTAESMALLVPSFVTKAVCERVVIRCRSLAYGCTDVKTNWGCVTESDGLQDCC